MGKFYRNLAGDIDGAVGSNYYSRIDNDVEIPSSDLQKYLLATNNFSNRIQNGINHYVMRDKRNNASFWQKLDLIVKNISRRQNLCFKTIQPLTHKTRLLDRCFENLTLEKKI